MGQVMGKFEDYLEALHDPLYNPLCDDCMAEKMGYSHRQQANIFSREARKAASYSRHKAPCNICGGQKFLTICENRSDKIRREPKTAPIKLPTNSTKKAHSTEDNPIFDLIEIGFEKIGVWKLIDEKLILKLSKGQDFSPALYFFANDAEVLYVGKTTQKLAKRLYFYGRPCPTQSTNIRLNSLIKERLQLGETISVYGYLHPQSVRIGRFSLDYPAALESGIIKELKPKWNVR